MTTLTCVSERYLGVPLEIGIEAHDRDLTGNDWIGLYNESDSRQTWDWLRGVSGRTHTHTFKTAVGEGNLKRDARGFALPVSLRAKVFRNGGWLSNGTLVGELEISLANPLEAVTAQVRGDAIEIEYTVKTNRVSLASSLFTLTTDDDVRVGRAPMVLEGRSGRVRIPVPRVGGIYHCNCLFRADGATALWRGQVRVASNGIADVFVSRNATSVMRNGLGSATVVRPGDTLFLRVAPPRAEYLTVDDLVHITEADAANIDGCPKARAFQVPVEKVPLRVDGTCRVVLRKPGIYYASLALKHPGAFLPAGTATIIVTERAPRANGAEASDDEQEAVSPPRRQRGPEIMSSRRVEDAPRDSDGSHLCIVCCDRAVAQMVRPCNHVCLCTRCDTEMRARNQLARCPMCRGSVDSTERVFF